MAAIEEQRRQFDIMQNNLAPWMNTGKWALDKQQAFLNGDVTGFENSPDYLWANQQGMNTLDQSAAARGGLFGGGHSKDLIKFGQGNAQQYSNSYWDKISGLSGTGNSTATNLGNAGMNMANQIGSQYNNIGNARASMYNRATQMHIRSALVMAWAACSTTGTRTIKPTTQAALAGIWATTQGGANGKHS